MIWRLQFGYLPSDIFLIYLTFTFSLFFFSNFLLCCDPFDLLASALSWWILITRLRDELTPKYQVFKKDPLSSCHSCLHQTLVYSEGKVQDFVDTFHNWDCCLFIKNIFYNKYLLLSNWLQLPGSMFCFASVNVNFNEILKLLYLFLLFQYNNFAFKVYLKDLFNLICWFSWLIFQSMKH